MNDYNKKGFTKYIMLKNVSGNDSFFGKLSTKNKHLWWFVKYVSVVWHSGKRFPLLGKTFSFLLSLLSIDPKKNVFAFPSHITPENVENIFRRNKQQRPISI